MLMKLIWKLAIEGIIAPTAVIRTSAIAAGR
jgi:hypothetical protein